MENEDAQNDLVVEVTRLLDKFRAGGNLAPVEDRADWEKLVASKSPEEQKLLEELSRFADLWRYLQDRKQKLGGEVLSALKRVGTLSVPERIALLHEINLKLMERVGDGGPGTELRH